MLLLRNGADIILITPWLGNGEGGEGVTWGGGLEDYANGVKVQKHSIVLRKR